MASLHNSATYNQGFGLTATTTIALDAGDLLTLTMRERDGGVPSVVSSDLDGALAFVIARGNGVGDHTRLYYLVALTTGTHTITVTFGGNSAFNGYVDAWRSTGTWSVVDQSNSAPNAATLNWVSGSITTTGGGVIVSAAAAGGAFDTPVAGAGYTIAFSLDKSIRQYKLTTMGETTDAPFTLGVTNSGNAAVMSFVETLGGGAAYPPFRPSYSLVRVA